MKKTLTLLSVCFCLHTNAQVVVSTLAGTPPSTDGIGAAARFGPPAGVAYDGNGNLYVADQYNNEIRKIVISTGMVTTLAGSTTRGSDDGIGAAAGFYLPTGVAYDGSGNLYVADYGNNKIRKIIISSGEVTTLAGSTTSGSADGTGAAASFNSPHGVACDGNGNLYVVDYYNHKIRKIVISSGVVTTLAGSGIRGATNGTGAAASFSYPTGLVCDGNDILYVADRGNNEIRKIVISSAEVTTFVGSTTYGSANGTGTAAGFDYPGGIACDGNGNLYVGDQNNNKIRQIVISSGVVTTLAGSGTYGYADGAGGAARFDSPFGVACDNNGNLYVADANNNVIRKVVISGAVVTTFAGAISSTDGTGAAARFNKPPGVAYDGKGNLYVADKYNHKIRKIVISSGVVTTFAGSGSGGSTDGTGVAARFYFPEGVTCDGKGNLFVADAGNNKIRKIVISSGVVTTFAGSGTSGSYDGTGVTARFYSPSGITCDTIGNLYVADVYNNSIRKIVISNAEVTTLAGSTTSGSADGTGAAAKFYYPSGVACDGNGNVYVADEFNNTIRKIVISTGLVTTFAGSSTSIGSTDGTGTTARFNHSSGIGYDGNGNLYVADENNNKIRKIVISSGLVTTLAGSGTTGATDGTGTVARFNLPSGVACDADGNVFIADGYNSEIRTITTKPTISANGTTLTSSSATGNQWYLDGNIIAGANQQIYIATQNGIYTFIANGETSVPYHLTSIIPKPIITANGPNIFCQGDSVILQSSVAVSYLWNNNATTRSITVSSSGNYAVTIKDSINRSATSLPVQVSVNPLPTTAIISGTTTICSGENTTLTVNNPCVACSYTWSNGMTGQSISVHSAGTYTTVATNNCGTASPSNALAVVLKALPAKPLITANDSTTFCLGDSVTLTSSAANAYLWSNNAITRSIKVFNSGNYSVKVINAGGCAATSASVKVTVKTVPTATITTNGPTTFCEGDSVILTSGAANSYLWNNNAITRSIKVFDPGNYFVKVIGLSGCAATPPSTKVIVKALPTVTVTANAATTFCDGDSVTLTSSIASAYMWNNNAITRSIKVFDAGNYSVKVSNASGCATTSSSTKVTVKTSPTVTVTANGATTICEGDSVTLTSSAANGYLWNNNAITRSIKVFNSGNYFVKVTNGNGCSATSPSTKVIVKALPTVTVTANGPTTFCRKDSVTLTSSAASAYLWNNNAITRSIKVFNSGNYFVKVVNGSGCSTTSAKTAVTVNALPTVTVTANGPVTFCKGDSVTLTSSAANAYKWNNNVITRSIKVFNSGNYFVKVVDGNGCAATSKSMKVTVNALPTVTVTANGSTTICQGDSVTLTSSAANTYLWNNNAITRSIKVFSSGNYFVKVVSASGCSATSATTKVTVKASPVKPTITVNGTTLTSSAASAYLWNNNATTKSITAPASGSYFVTVTNGSGCSAKSDEVSVVKSMESESAVEEEGVIADVSVLNQESSFTIMPNPNNGKFKLGIKNMTITKIRIYDITGEIVYQSDMNAPEIDLSNQSKGIYFIQIVSGGEVSSKKFIIE